jgi:hypothetical protein
MLKRGLLAVAALTAVGLGAVWCLWPAPAIGQSSYERIQLGMTPTEVEAVIGLPPGDYSGRTKANRPVICVRTQEKWPADLVERPTGDLLLWIGREHTIGIALHHEQVTYCTLRTFRAPEPPGILARIRSWLGW